VYNALQKDLLCGQKWKSVGEVEAHLVSEDALCSRSGAVGLGCPLGLDAL
jgi:hypothetical protein